MGQDTAETKHYVLQSVYHVILEQLNFLSKNIKMSQKPKCYIILETNFLAAFLRYKVMIIEEFTIYNDVIAGCA